MFEECKQNLGPSQPGIGGRPTRPSGTRARRGTPGRAARARTRRRPTPATRVTPSARSWRKDGRQAGRPRPDHPRGRPEALGRCARPAAGRRARRRERRPTTPAKPDASRNETKRTARRTKKCSSTTSSSHEQAPPSSRRDRGQPRAGGSGHGARGHRRRVHRLRRQLRAALRAHLRPQGRAAQRRQAGQGQRGPRGRLPRRRRREIEARARDRHHGEDEETVAIIDLKLDKTVEPLPQDTSFTVRPRSALGPQVRRGRPGQVQAGLRAGDRAAGNGGVDSEPPIELEDVLSTFDSQTREASKAGLEGFGSAPGRPRTSRSTRPSASSTRCCDAATR